MLDANASRGPLCTVPVPLCTAGLASLGRSCWGLDLAAAVWASGQPAWAVADSAVSGNKSEITRKLFFNIVRLHHGWKRVSALLMMSSEQIVWRLQAHADVKPPGTALYQRNSRGPNAAPANVHSTIVPPYQTATNGNESSMQ